MDKFREMNQDTISTRAQERYRNISPASKEFLENLYKTEKDESLKPFFRIMDQTDAVKDKTSLLQEILVHTIDSGMNQVRECKVNGTAYTENEVMMVGRGYFTRRISQYVDQLTDNDTRQLSFLMTDVANLRGADFPVEGYVAKPADVMVNKVGRQLDNVVLEACKEKQVECLNGRYGGDEFMTALFGNYDQQFINDLTKQLIDRFGQIPAYYKGEDGNITEKHIELKDGQIPVITVPESGIQRDIFKNFLHRGIILNEAQINQIINKFSQGNDMSAATERLMAYLHSQQNMRRLYPENIPEDNLVEKIKYLQSVHSELRWAFQYAGELDKAEEPFSVDQNHTHRYALVRYIEDIMFDPLLRDNVYNRFDFQEHLSRGEFSNVIMIDLKFIKEINEDISFAHGDEAILTLWDRIKNSLSSEDRANVMAARYGGSIILGLRAGKKLSDEAKNKLRSLTSLTLFEDTENKMTIPLGSVDYDLSDMTYMDTTNEAARMLFDRLLEDAENTWYDQVIDQLQNDSQLLNIVNQQPVDSVEVTLARGIETPYQKTLWHFFHGKRLVERCSRIMDRLNTEKYKDNENYKTVRQTFVTILKSK